MSVELPRSLVYDWNTRGIRSHDFEGRTIELLDETLRDGLQSPSVIDPPIEHKRGLLDLMDHLGIHAADVGLPGAGPRMVRHVRALVEHIRDTKLAITPSCAARTLAADIEPIIALSQETGVEIEVLAFLGASPIRAHAEGWTVSRMHRLTRDAVRLGVRASLPVAFVTEDTIRANPEVLDRLFKAAIDEGSHRLVLCDTVGHATPDGVRSLVEWTRELIESTGVDIKIDFHGHNDRGLALINSLAAIRAGCDRIHGTALGIGERVGNTAMDQVLVNLTLMGSFNHDLTDLVGYCQHASEAFGRPIPQNYPVVGPDAFRTATGVHASAIVKAMRMGSTELVDSVYSGIPAHLVGRSQVIEVGHLSGESNVLAWLDSRGFAPNPALVAEIWRVAKRGNRTLNEGEINAIVRKVLAPPVP